MSIMHYLWRDKSGQFYITDYKETDAVGRVKIDGYGYLEVELIFSNVNKPQVLAYAVRFTSN